MSVLEALSEAVSRAQLPSLTQLSLIECKCLKEKLSLLFQTVWPKLRSLNLQRTNLNLDDLQSVFETGNDLLPDITSLSLSPDCVSYIMDPKVKPLLCSLTSLNLVFVLPYRVSLLNAMILDMLPLKLISLALSLPRNVSLSLPSQHITSLESLTLHRCISETEHLSLAVTDGLNLKLCTLDISHSSGITRNLPRLPRHSFPELNSLILSETHRICAVWHKLV